MVQSFTSNWCQTGGFVFCSRALELDADRRYAASVVRVHSGVTCSNLQINKTFTGTFDEAWFYLIPLGVEAAGAPAIKALSNAQALISSGGDACLVTREMQVVRECIEGMCLVMHRMYEHLDADVFYNLVRPYSGGSKNSSSFPNGIFYEGVCEVVHVLKQIDEYVNASAKLPDGRTGTWRMYAGASAGQSPLIHTLDVALGIVHHHMPAQQNVKGPNPMMEMRSYLPIQFQDFITQIGSSCSIQDFAKANLETAHVYNQCLLGMKTFRDIHIRMTSVYIIAQHRKVRVDGESAEDVGTGGTALIPFLKQTRQETITAMI